jgi:methionyl-tRNA formyltransferase
VRVIFFGSPAFAVPTLHGILGSSHELAGVVTQPDRPRGRGQHVTDGPVKVAARSHGIPVLQPERLNVAGVADAVAALGADLGVVAAYGKILPEWLIALPPRGMINVHASLLPRYRGAAPVQRAVMAGEPRTGVTIMRVVKALDAGPMLDRVEIPIGPDDTSDEVERALAARGAELLVAVVDRLSRGPVAEVPQVHDQATYAAKVTRLDGPVDWRRPAQAIHDQIRGLHPWPHASSMVDGRRVILHRSQTIARPTNRTPGTVEAVGPDGLDVAAGDGVLLRLVELQAEGGRRLTAAQFQAGRGLVAGQRFDLP